MITKQRIIGLAGAGILGLGLLASQTTAQVVDVELSCKDVTPGWDNNGLHFGCYEEGTQLGVEVSSLSGTSNGVKGLIADLMADNHPGQGRAWAVGIGNDGREIPGCKTQEDTSTAKGATVGDGNGGCENAIKHRLWARIKL